MPLQDIIITENDFSLQRDFFSQISQALAALILVRFRILQIFRLIIWIFLSSNSVNVNLGLSAESAQTVCRQVAWSPAQSTVWSLHNATTSWHNRLAGKPELAQDYTQYLV